MRLEDLQRFVLVDEETGRIEYGCFISVVGAVMRIFGRPPTHTHPAEDFPLEEDEADALGAFDGYVIGRVEWEQRPVSPFHEVLRGAMMTRDDVPPFFI